MSKISKTPVVAIIVAGILLLFFLRLTLSYKFHTFVEGGELPFIPSQFYLVKNGDSVFLEKSSLEACVEMVMHYWGTPPSQAEVEAMLRENLDASALINKILRAHRLSSVFVAGLDEDLIKRILALNIPIIALCNERNYQGMESNYFTWIVIWKFKNANLIFNDPETTFSLEMDYPSFSNAYWKSTNTAALLIYPPFKKKLLAQVLPPSCLWEGEIYRGISHTAGHARSNREIIQYLMKKLKKSSSSAFLNYSLGWRLTREGKSEGLQYLRRAMELNPLHFYQIEFAISFCYVHKEKEALQRLKSLIKENPEYISIPSVFFHLCYLLRREGKTEEIDHLFKKAIVNAPPHLLASLTEVYTWMLSCDGRHEEALKLLKNLFAKYPWLRNWKNKCLELSTLSLLVSKGRLNEADKLASRLWEEGVPAARDWLQEIKLRRNLYQGNLKEAEEIYQRNKNPSLAMIFLKAKGEWVELQKVLSQLLVKFSPESEELYEEKVWAYPNKISILLDYIDVCRHLNDYKSEKEAIKDFLNIHENIVMLGCERQACYGYARGGIICYWEGDEAKAKEWLSKAYHNPYFKELDPLLVKDVSKALKELEKTNP